MSDPIDPTGRTDDTEREPQRSATDAAAASPELEGLRADRDRLQDQLTRSLADLANVRRRQGHEVERARAGALEGLAAELLPVLDNFDAALAAPPGPRGADDVEPLRAGLMLVRSLLTAALERHGLRQVEAEGAPFDPNVHEAVGMDSEAPVAEGRVAKVLQHGYYLGDRLLRPSRVLVKGRPAQAADADRGADLAE